MALESASFISQLNTANPAPTDLLGQGDDHLRLIKAVLKATFPNLTGAVTVTQDDLNSAAALLNGGGGLVPVGAVTAWWGADTAVPDGWALCHGGTVSLSDGSGTMVVPDLRDLVIMGAGTIPLGTGYGAPNATATTAASGAHSHATTAGEGGHIHAGVTTAGHALTVSEIPAHTHTIDGYKEEGFDGPNLAGAGGSVSAPKVSTSSTGSGNAHSHGMSWPTTPDGTHTHTTDTAAAHTHGVTVSTYQPALALHYIIKV